MQACASNSSKQNLGHLFSKIGAQCKDHQLSEKILKNLIQKHVDFEQKDSFGRLPFHYAVENNFSLVINKLIEMNTVPKPPHGLDAFG